MQGTPVAKKRDYSGRVYGQRQCIDCPVLFIANSSGQKRCTDCQAAHTRKLGREYQARKRKAEYKPRYCLDCGTELPPPNGSARPRVRCIPCAKAYKVAHDRARNKQRTESGARKVYDERWREANREAIRAANRRYKSAHPETDQAAIHRRRQRREVGMDELDRALSTSYRAAIRTDPCFYCGAPPSATDETDHFFPLSKGGTDHFYNLVRSCRGCNRGACGKGIMCGTAFMLRTGNWSARSLPSPAPARLIVPSQRPAAQGALF